MVLYDAIWCYMLLYRAIGDVWCYLVLSGAIWCYILLYGVDKFLKMVWDTVGNIILYYFPRHFLLVLYGLGCLLHTIVVFITPLLHRSGVGGHWYHPRM